LPFCRSTLTGNALGSTNRAEQPPQAFINELCNLGTEACMEPPGQKAAMIARASVRALA